MAGGNVGVAATAVMSAKGNKVILFLHKNPRQFGVFVQYCGRLETLAEIEIVRLGHLLAGPEPRPPVGHKPLYLAEHKPADAMSLKIGVHHKASHPQRAVGDVATDGANNLSLRILHFIDGATAEFLAEMFQRLQQGRVVGPVETAEIRCVGLALQLQQLGHVVPRGKFHFHRVRVPPVYFFQRLS